MNLFQIFQENLTNSNVKSVVHLILLTLFNIIFTDSSMINLYIFIFESYHFHGVRGILPKNSKKYLFYYL